jgi:hypothetical protein
MYIAANRNSAMTMEKNDILNFLGSYFLSISWRFHINESGRAISDSATFRLLLENAKKINVFTFLSGFISQFEH